MKNRTLFEKVFAIYMILTLWVGCSPPVTEASSPIVPRTVSPTFTSLPTEDSAASTKVTEPSLVTQTLTVGTYAYVMECIGTGSPTVLLLGGRAETWKPLQTEMSSSNRMCVFEHAGSQSTPLTVEEIARNVHTLIQDVEIPGPYVLVGFSAGGLIARLFTDLFPEEVAGMALLDASHEDQNARFLAALPAESTEDCQELKNYRSELQSPHILPIGSEIRLDFDASADLVRAIETDLGNLPLVVLTAGRSDWPACFPSEVQEDLNKTWLDLQENLAGLSTNSTHLVAAESSHSFAEQPDIVLETIRQAVQAAQTGAVP